MILDNRTTAMTGHQDHPGNDFRLGGEKVRQVEIEQVVRACGVDQVYKVSAFDVKGVEQTFKDALAYDGPAVIIVEGPCFFVGPGASGTYAVDGDACNACGICLRLGCPAIYRSDEVFAKTGKPKSAVDPVLCVGCDMCAQVCLVNSLLNFIFSSFLIFAGLMISAHMVFIPLWWGLQGHTKPWRLHKISFVPLF